jgi:sulfur relay (sulfurtransferase) DsrF/TusC family protein
MKLAVILKKPPYGEIHAAEAVRHALGAVGDDIEVSLLLVGGGVLLSKADQSEGQTGYTNLGEALKDLADMGGEILADKASLREYGLDAGDLIESVTIANSHAISEKIQDAEKSLIF